MFDAIIRWLRGERQKGRFYLKEQAFTIQDSLIFPTKETVINIHDIIVESFESSNPLNRITRGIRFEPNLDHMLYHMKEYVGSGLDKKEEKSIEKALYLLNFMFTSHTFNDGNKRTGYVIFILFLMMNKISIRPYAMGAYKSHVEFFKRMAARRLDDDNNIPELEAWFNKHIRLG